MDYSFFYHHWYSTNVPSKSQLQRYLFLKMTESQESQKTFTWDRNRSHQLDSLVLKISFYRQMLTLTKHGLQGLLTSECQSKRSLSAEMTMEISHTHVIDIYVCKLRTHNILWGIFIVWIYKSGMVVKTYFKFRKIRD